MKYGRGEEELGRFKDELVRGSGNFAFPSAPILKDLTVFSPESCKL